MDLPQARAAIRLTAEAVAHLPGRETGQHQILDRFRTGGREWPTSRQTSGLGRRVALSLANGVSTEPGCLSVGPECRQIRVFSNSRTRRHAGRQYSIRGKNPDTTANFADEAVAYCGYHSSNRTSIPVPSKAF